MEVSQRPPPQEDDSDACDRDQNIGTHSDEKELDTAWDDFTTLCGKHNTVPEVAFVNHIRDIAPELMEDLLEYVGDLFERLDVAQVKKLTDLVAKVASAKTSSVGAGKNLQLFLPKPDASRKGEDVSFFVRIVYDNLKTAKAKGYRNIVILPEMKEMYQSEGLTNNPKIKLLYSTYLEAGLLAALMLAGFENSAVKAYCLAYQSSIEKNDRIEFDPPNPSIFEGVLKKSKAALQKLT